MKTLFWDTAGQERYRSIAHNVFRGADGVILVYDVTDADSFVDLKKWMADLDQVTEGSGGKMVNIALESFTYLANQTPPVFTSFCCCCYCCYCCCCFSIVVVVVAAAAPAAAFLVVNDCEELVKVHRAPKSF